MALAAQARDQREQVAPALRIERAHRLVEDQQSRLVRRAPGRSRAAGASRPSSRRSAAWRPPSGPIALERSRRRASGAPRRPARGGARPARAARGPSSSRRSAGPGRGSRSGDGAPARRAPTSTPATDALPAVGRASPVRIRSVVVLPAPFGPSRPKTDPAGTSRSSPSSARTAPNRFVRPRAGPPDGQVARSRGDAGHRRGHASSRPTTK